MPDIREGCCPQCRHDEIIQAAPLVFVEDAAVVLSVSHDVNGLGADPRKPLGPLNLFVCRRCGYSQFFAFEPEKIPVGIAYGTRLIKGSTSDGGPYR